MRSHGSRLNQRFPNILAPVTHQHANVDWDAEKGRFRDLILRQVRKAGNGDLMKRIRYERMFTPVDWDKTYQIHMGATFNLARRTIQQFEEGVRDWVRLEKDKDRGPGGAAPVSWPKVAVVFSGMPGLAAVVGPRGRGHRGRGGEHRGGALRRRTPKPVSFAPDAITREVIDLVERKFPEHPGDLKHFSWPVTSDQAAAALEDFIANRLSDFGRHQDAMWTEEPFLNHSLISTSLNLKLLNPRKAVAAAEQAYREGRAPLAAVEGFVRGIYWRLMPGYVEMNMLKAETPLPAFYWTGKTEMNCLRQVIGQTLEHGYAHHIQRLMVTGLFAMLLGVRLTAEKRAEIRKQAEEVRGSV